MPITRPRPEAVHPRAFVVVAVAFGAVAAAAACSDTTVQEADVSPPGDASVEAEASVVVDAGADAPPPRPPKPTSDAGPAPVTCAAPPCAKSLVTTHGNGGFCVLLEDATVACWGSNGDGQLGQGEASMLDSATPARVPGLSNIVSLENSCAVDRAGGAWCWGTGAFLRSTASAYTVERAPVKLDLPPVRRVGVRFGSMVSIGCAVTVANDVVCWGMNAHGQIRPPVPGEDPAAADPVTTVPVPVGASIEGIFVGDATFVLRSDGTLTSWGMNPPLGRVSSLSPDPNPKPIALGGVSYVDAVEGNACVVAEGSVWCWGSTVPALGGPLTNALPRKVDLPEPMVAVATTNGQYGGTYFNAQRACAVGISGEVYCWGANSSGQAGDGTHEYAVRPVKVKGLPGPASIVRTAAYTTCALLTTGKVHCWGENGYGELGNGFIQDPSVVPTEALLP